MQVAPLRCSVFQAKTLKNCTRFVSDGTKKRSDTREMAESASKLAGTLRKLLNTNEEVFAEDAKRRTKAAQLAGSLSKLHHSLEGGLSLPGAAASEKVTSARLIRQVLDGKNRMVTSLHMRPRVKPAEMEDNTYIRREAMSVCGTQTHFNDTLRVPVTARIAPRSIPTVVTPRLLQRRLVIFAADFFNGSDLPFRTMKRGVYEMQNLAPILRAHDFGTCVFPAGVDVSQLLTLQACAASNGETEKLRCYRTDSVVDLARSLQRAGHNIVLTGVRGDGEGTAVDTQRCAVYTPLNVPMFRPSANIAIIACGDTPPSAELLSLAQIFVTTDAGDRCPAALLSYVLSRAQWTQDDAGYYDGVEGEEGIEEAEDTEEPVFLF